MYEKEATKDKLGQTFLTDYPFKGLGDMPRNPAPIRSVVLVEYLRLPWCKVWLPDGSVDETKIWYLY